MKAANVKGCYLLAGLDPDGGWPDGFVVAAGGGVAAAAGSAAATETVAVARVWLPEASVAE